MDLSYKVDLIRTYCLGNNKDEMQVNTDELAMYIQGERRYKIGDLVKVKLTEVREETRSIVGQLII